jgi:hypothetical protein
MAIYLQGGQCLGASGRQCVILLNRKGQRRSLVSVPSRSFWAKSWGVQSFLSIPKAIGHPEQLGEIESRLLLNGEADTTASVPSMFIV